MHKVKRVPLDFDWPINNAWKGYENPHYAKCPDCDAGYSKTHEAIGNHVMGLCWDKQVGRDPHYTQLTTWLCGRAPRGTMGHDSMDRLAAVEKLGKLAGLPEGWHLCKTCGGSAIHPDHKEQYEAWEEYDPPTGDGYQMWLYDGKVSPITRVFATPEELANEMVHRLAGAKKEETRQAWLRMINETKEEAQL